MSYRVMVELDAPSATYDVGRVTAAVALALSDHESVEDLVVSRIEVERWDV